MRRLYFMFFLAAVVLSGCSKQRDMEFDPVDNEGYTILEADLESLLFEDNERIWPEDSYIGVFGSEQGSNECYTIKNASEGLRRATFYGPLVKGEITAYYPYDPLFDGKAELTASQQEYVAGNDVVEQFFTYTPRAYAQMQDGVLRFVYPNGVMKVTVETFETLKIKNITLSSEEADYEVYLDCGSGVLSREGEVYTGFYLVLAPGIYRDLEIVIDIDGEPAFSRILPPVEVKKVESSDFAVTSVAVSASGGPDDFVDTPVEFE